MFKKGDGDVWTASRNDLCFATTNRQTALTITADLSALDLTKVIAVPAAVDPSIGGCTRVVETVHEVHASLASTLFVAASVLPLPVL